MKSEMKKKRRRLSEILLFMFVQPTFFLFIFPSCSKPSIAFTFTKIKEIQVTLAHDKVLCEIADVNMDDEGNFYVVDSKCHTVYVLDPHGRMIRQIGSEGRGPGELRNPVAVTFKEDDLAVLDRGNRRISIFHKNGQYVSSIHVQGAYLSGVVFKDTTKLAVSESLGIEDIIFYDVSGKRLSKMHTPRISPVTLPITTIGGQMSVLQSGNIIFSPLRRYNVTTLNWDGDTLRTFKFKPPGYFAPDLSSKRNFENRKNWALVLKPIQYGSYILIQWSRRKPPPYDQPKESNWKNMWISLAQMVKRFNWV